MKEQIVKIIQNSKLNGVILGMSLWGGEGGGVGIKKPEGKTFGPLCNPTQGLHPA